MANSHILLADLKAARCSNTSEVRLLRFWEARNVRKGGQLMSINMLFLEKDSTLMQGSVSANRQARFRERLFEGCTYTLSGFDVVRSGPNFRMCDSPHFIRFNDGTLLEESSKSITPIPTEIFRFMPYSQIVENIGKQLPDIMGELDAIRSTITDSISGAQRVMLTLRLESGENVCVGLFDSMALEWHAKFDSYGKEPTIVIATSVNPKIVGGRLYLNATSATHLFFDDQTQAGKASFQAFSNTIAYKYNSRGFVNLKHNLTSSCNSSNRELVYVNFCTLLAPILGLSLQVVTVQMGFRDGHDAVHFKYMSSHIIKILLSDLCLSTE